MHVSHPEVERIRHHHGCGFATNVGRQKQKQNSVVYLKRLQKKLIETMSPPHPRSYIPLRPAIGVYIHFGSPDEQDLSH